MVLPKESKSSILYFVKHHSYATAVIWRKAEWPYPTLMPIPIRTMNFDDPADMARHDKMVALLERMLALHKKLAAATIPADKQLYQRQIEATDRQIDALVYELYGLTEEEIGVVEGQNH